MKIYAIHKDAYNWSDISFFRTAMYHGMAILPPKRIGTASHELSEKRIKPMRVMMNLAFDGEIRIPTHSSNLIISERILESLAGIQGTFRLTPVIIEKLIHCDEHMPECEKYAGRELSLFDEVEPVEVPSDLPGYYEVITPNHYRLLEKIKPTQNAFTRNYPGKRIALDDLPVSAELFQENPITNAGFPIMREDLYRRLARYLEIPYFGIKEMVIT